MCNQAILYHYLNIVLKWERYYTKQLQTILEYMEQALTGCKGDRL